MRERQLGSCGPRVGAVGLGGMPLSIRGRPIESQAIRTIRAALEEGVTFIDTADVYCLDDSDLGHNERLIAKALSNWPSRVIVATKGGMRRPGGRWVRDARPERIIAACEHSLRALRVEAIDLYQLHVPDPGVVPYSDSVGALARLHEQGKIQFVGLSNVTVEQIKVARDIVPIASVQNRWNLYDRSPERNGVLAACERFGISFLPYSPFGGVAGAQKIGETHALVDVARNLGISPHRAILAWMLAKSPMVIAIPGARREATIRDSAAAESVDLTLADMAAIEAAFLDEVPR